MKDFHPDIRVIHFALLYLKDETSKESVLEALNMCAGYYHVKIKKMPKIQFVRALVYFSDIRNSAQDRISKLYYSI